MNLRSTLCIAGLTPLIGLSAQQQQLQQLPTVSVAAADSLAASIVIYAAAAANGTSGAYPAEHPRLVCVQGPTAGSDPRPEVLKHLEEFGTMLVRPLSRCVRDPQRSTRMPLMVDSTSGKRGIRIAASQTRFTSDTSFVVNTDYWEHFLSAGYWLCEGRRREGKWTIISCKLLGMA